MSFGLYFGETFEAPVAAGVAPNTSNNYYGPRAATDSVENIRIGAKTIVNFVPVVKNIAGSKMNTFYDDWYNRIHLMPRAIDLLNVISDQTRDVTLWNAFFSNKVLSSTSFPVGQGINVLGGVATPYTLKPLEILTYSLEVSAEGPPAIDVDLEWNIDGEKLTVNILGRRIVVWPFPPNWVDPVEETLEFFTDIFTAYNGDEQRRALRSKPRRNIEYISLLKSRDAAISNNLLWGWQNRNFALPLWFDKTRLTVGAASGSLTLNADTIDRGFFNGGLILLYASSTDYEAIQIISFTTNSIQLSKGLERSWPANTLVFPINIAKLPRNVSSNRLTSGVLRLATSFQCDPVQTDPHLPVAAAPITHNGYEVILKRPNFAQPVDVSHDFEYDTVDFLIGNISSIPSHDHAKTVRRFQWTCRSHAEIREVRSLLGRLKGRAKAAYMPTWFEDFELYESEAIGAMGVRVLSNEFHKMVGNDPALNTLLIRLTDGTNIIRTIDSTGIDGEITTLGITAALTSNINKQNVRVMSLVHLCRLSADRTTIKWLTDGRATIDASFTLVKA